MQVHITIRGLDEKEAAKNSSALRNYIQDKFQRVESFLSEEQQPINVDIVATIVHPHPNHEFEIHIRAPKFSVIAKRHGPEIYALVDEVIDIVHEDFVKHKERIIETRRREGAELKKKDRSI